MTTPEPARPVHPAEVDFDAWCEQWLRRRAYLCRSLGQPLPSPAKLAAEMMDALKSDNPEDW